MNFYNTNKKLEEDIQKVGKQLSRLLTKRDILYDQWSQQKKTSSKVRFMKVFKIGSRVVYKDEIYTVGNITKTGKYFIKPLDDTRGKLVIEPSLKLSRNKKEIKSK